jgi:hypothetical protein
MRSVAKRWPGSTKRSWSGHTHQRLIRELSGAPTYVNAGSVVTPYKGRPGAFWLLLDDGRPSLRQTGYDVDAAAAKLRAAVRLHRRRKPAHGVTPQSDRRRLGHGVPRTRRGPPPRSRTPSHVESWLMMTISGSGSRTEAFGCCGGSRDVWLRVSSRIVSIDLATPAVCGDRASRDDCSRLRRPLTGRLPCVTAGIWIGPDPD